MFDKVITLFILGALAGLFSYGVGAFFDERKSVIKTTLISICSVLFFGISYEYLYVEKPPLIFAVIFSFFTGLLMERFLFKKPKTA